MTAGSEPHQPRLAGQALRQLVGTLDGGRDERNGYWFWGLIAVFIGVPDVLAGLSKTLRAKIPWPTISNLVGKHLEARHHWVALLVVSLIVVVTAHALTYPIARKQAGRALRAPADEAERLPWGGRYIAFVAAATSAAGLVAAALGATKNELGYAIYLTLAAFGVLVPSALAYWWNRVLAIPTLFAALALLRAHAPWVALVVAALLALLLFHLALYPWPNYHFGTA
jgi:hypothetical protein